jgi:hypothetical protein
MKKPAAANSAASRLKVMDYMDERTQIITESKCIDAATRPLSTALLKYDAACRAVAEAKTLDEVRDWEDKAAAVREYILADPPWHFIAYSDKGEGRSASSHYTTDRASSAWSTVLIWNYTRAVSARIG